MTKREIHIKSVLKKKGYEFSADFGRMSFNKYWWKKVEPKKKKTYCHVVIHIINGKAYPTFFTEFTFRDVRELEKYYIVYNRVISDLKELGL